MNTKKTTKARRLPDLATVAPADIAAAMAEIADPLERYLYCSKRWPAFIESHDHGTLMAFYRVNAEWLRLFKNETRARLEASLSQMRPKARGQTAQGPTAKRKRAHTNARAACWPDFRKNVSTYHAVIPMVVQFIDQARLPHQGECARIVGISRPRYCLTWARVAKWVHRDLRSLYLKAERAFRAELLLRLTLPEKGGIMEPCETPLTR